MTPRIASDELPEDLRIPEGFVMASLEEQIRAARQDLHRWVAFNEPRTRVERGRGSMHVDVFMAGRQRRLSIIHTLLKLQQQERQQGETSA